MIGKHSRLAIDAAAESHTGSVKLRQVHLNDIVFSHQSGGDLTKGWGDRSLAQAKKDRHANDLDAVQHFCARQGFIVLRGHHCDLVPAFSERARQPLGINGKARSMRAIIGQNGEDFHEAVDIILLLTRTSACCRQGQG